MLSAGEIETESNGSNVSHVGYCLPGRTILWRPVIDSFGLQNGSRVDIHLQQLSLLSGYSVRTLKRYFHVYLSKPPMFSVYPSERVNLLIDGTYFSNDLCLILYRDNTIKFTQLYRLTTGEWYEELKEDLENLLSLKVQIESITCDGHKALLKAIKRVCPDIILQRYVVHILRMCRIWLTMKPKTVPGIELRSIVSKPHTIKTAEDRDYWIVSLANGINDMKAFLMKRVTS